MRILVTGSNGLVGSRLCRQLSAQGHDVTAIGRGANRTQGAFTYFECDATDENALSLAFERARAESVINAASMTEVDACEKDAEQAEKVNARMPATLARLCAAANVHLVHISTDYVFDGESGPYDESAVPHPRGVYATTKHAGEEAVRAASSHFAVARTAVVYGWPPAARLNFGAWVVETLRQGKPIKLFEDQFVSPTLAENVAAMVGELALRKLGGVWHTSGRDVVSRIAFGRALCGVFGFDFDLLVPTRLFELQLASPRPLRSGLVVTKAAGQLSAKPLGLPEALAAFFQECSGSA